MRPSPPRRALAIAALGLSLLSAGGRAPGQEATPTPAPKPRVWAVVVGVEGYKGNIPRRVGAQQASSRLASWFKVAAGWGPGSVLQLDDEGADAPLPGQAALNAKPPQLRPTRSNLKWAMDTWLQPRVARGDVVVIAFTGRGVSTPAGEGLLPVDARAGEAGWSPDRDVERFRNAAKAAAVIAWIDAPMIGPGGAPSADPAAGARLLDRLSRWPGASAWLANREPKADPKGSTPFAEALLDSLGARPRTLLASLGDLNRSPKARDAGLRVRGGLPADLTLGRDAIRAPAESRPILLVQDGHPDRVAAQADRVAALAVRADGRAIASASEDSTIRVWDPTDRDRPLIRVLPHFLHGVAVAAFSPDGRYLAGGDGGGTVLAFDLADPDPDARPIAPAGPPAHSGRVIALAFLPESRPADESAPPQPARFVTLDAAGRVEAWELDGRGLRKGDAPLLDAGGLRLAVATAPSPAGATALVVAGLDGRLHRFDAGARPLAILPAPEAPGRPTSLDLAPDGRFVAVGDDRGRARVIDLANGRIVVDVVPTDGVRVQAVRFGPGGMLAVGTEAGVDLVPNGHQDRTPRLEGLDDEVATLEFSPDGSHLAAVSASGDLHLWSLGGGDFRATPLPIEGNGGGRVASLAFGPASGPPRLVVGEDDGGIRRWMLPPGGKPVVDGPRIAPHRGKVAGLAADRAGRHLLTINGDKLAGLWDLREGRHVRPIPGRYHAGTFLNDGRIALARHPDSGGGLVRFDPASAKLDVFPRPARPGAAGAPGEEYGLVSSSRDSKRVAAASAPGRGERVVIWGSDPAGAYLPLRAFEAHERPITAIEVAADGRTLLTAAEDGTAKLWPLDDGVGPPPPPVATLKSPRIAAMTAARMSPTVPGRVAAAGVASDGDGLVVLFEDATGPAPRVIDLGRLPGRVLALAFLGDGRYLAAAGRDRRLRVWDLAGRPGARPAEIAVLVDPARPSSASSPHHAERINDLLAWPLAGDGPGGPTLVSGSDDTLVRFWRVEPAAGRATLLGSLTGSPTPIEPAAAKPAAPGADREEIPWVAFTPEGVYDGSREGDGMVSFVDRGVVGPLNQYAERFFRPLLADDLRRGLRPARKSYTPPPPLRLDVPEEVDALAAREVELRISLGDRAIAVDALRLYQNDAPIGAEFTPTGAPGEYRATATLVRGDNRFHALAARPDDVDARSGDLTLYHAGEGARSKVHVLALGVGKYDRNALRFPATDAKALADFLRDHGVGAGPAAKAEQSVVLLTDDKVTGPAIDEEFLRLRRRVKGRPEDTVVVFLAGHADLIADRDGQDRFCLLLPDFPFPAADPGQAALRGPNLTRGGGATTAIPESSILAYASIYRGLAGLDALRRLVIVDACQAGAVVDDPGAQVVRRLRAVERDARRSRLDYLLAARRGEAAEEAPELQHGLMTYALLRGMGDPKLGRPAPEIDRRVFGANPGADADGDGTITTRELRLYLERVLPPLAAALTGVDRNAGRAPGAKPAPPVPADVQASGISFPLVTAPGK